MSAEQTVPTSPAPPPPQDPWAGDEVSAAGPTVPLGGTVAPAPAPPVQLQPIPVPPVPQRPVPERWAGRVKVPGATGPGQKKAAAPTAPTQKLARYAEPTPTVIGPRARPAAPRPDVPVARPKRRRGRRFLGALIALALILAVPVVSAYVAYKLTAGENPFEWPPTMDLSRIL